MLIPSYNPVLNKMKPTNKTITVWPNDAASVLLDCFASTDWQIFKEAAKSAGEVDLDEYASSLTSYIRKCVDDVTSMRIITIHPNQKPWMNAEVRTPLLELSEPGILHSGLMMQRRSEQQEGN